MAIDLYSDSSSMGISPRISFSHDLSQTDGVIIEQYRRSPSPSSADFDFCVFRESFDHESSSADELFSGGKILPIEIKRQLDAPKKTDPIIPSPTSTPPPLRNSSEKKSEVLESELQKSNSKSFWGFKRSSSLNCGSGYARTLCPIPLLSRSNSTGSTSTANGKRSENSTSRFKKSLTTASSIKQSSQSTEKSPTAHHKPPLKKNYGPYGGGGGHNSNGVKFSPVLNVPTPLLFGLGSIFSSSKDNNKSKKR